MLPKTVSCYVPLKDGIFYAVIGEKATNSFHYLPRGALLSGTGICISSPDLPITNLLMFCDVDTRTLGTGLFVYDRIMKRYRNCGKRMMLPQRNINEYKWTSEDGKTNSRLDWILMGRI
jgi:hypothetical protein